MSPRVHCSELARPVIEIDDEEEDGEEEGELAEEVMKAEIPAKVDADMVEKEVVSTESLGDGGPANEPGLPDTGPITMSAPNTVEGTGLQFHNSSCDQNRAESTSASRTFLCETGGRQLEAQPLETLGIGDIPAPVESAVASSSFGVLAVTGRAGASKPAAKQYLVDNSLLQAKTQGLGYRFSKVLNDIDKTATAAWGTTVVGFDEGDGWLRVDGKYLPMESSGKPVLTAKMALARTTSSTLYSAPTTLAQLSILKPAGMFIPRAPGPSEEQKGVLRRQGSWSAPAPAGLFIPRSPGSTGEQGGGLKRRSSDCSSVWAMQSCSADDAHEKKPRVDEGLANVDTEGRRYNLEVVVVNFANVGATFACKVLGRDKQRGDRLFDWEGVRRCVRHLREELGMSVIGVVMENFWAPDNSKDYKIGIPADIRSTCDSIEETPKLIGRNHKSADDEMTIKCAYRRNCRFLDNDNYRDWIKEMRNDRCRTWLEHCQETLQMRYFFDAQLGTFDTLDGKSVLLSSRRTM